MGSIRFGALVADPRGSLGLEDSVLVPPMVDPWGPLGLELFWQIHGIRWVWRTLSSRLSSLYKTAVCSAKLTLFHCF